MIFSKHYQYLSECGYRELGYFSGMQVFLGVDSLVTVAEQGSGYLVTFDSVARNIGIIEYVCNESQLMQLLSEVIVIEYRRI